MKTHPFWFVWNPNNRIPQYEHQSYINAEFEAKRLAQKHPGEQFIVLQSIRSFTVNNINEIDLAPDEIPF